ncbi:MAG: helix-turn-helix transcriptional regulator [Lachnospiraceae bacterium]|nr:helix-turn-helix transcriptional regulator [Candidatus Colinaster equi]
MNRYEKKNFVVKSDSEIDSLSDEQERVKYVVMRDFVKYRKERGVTQEELARRTGIARPNIARMESGSYNPTIDMLCRMGEAIGMKIDITWRA